MMRLVDERGFALTELLIATVLVGVVLGSSLVVFSGFNNQQRRVDRTSEAQSTARRAIDRMAVELRSATSGDTTGTQAVEKATAYDLVFLAPSGAPDLSNNARGVMHVRYCLDASTVTNELLWLQTAPYNTSSSSTPPSTTSCPSSAWPNQRHLADHLVNQRQSPAAPLFTTLTDGTGKVTNVEMHALVDVDVTKDPSATNLRSGVNLRNLNRAPAAAVSCQAQSNGHALCDASASSDPNGENLTYSWEMDGSPLSQTSYRLDQSGLASHSTHTFRVTVTDPGGLTSSATQTVTMP